MGDSGTSSHITWGHLVSFIPFVLELNSVSYDIRLEHDKNGLQRMSKYLKLFSRCTKQNIFSEKREKCIPAVIYDYISYYVLHTLYVQNINYI